MKRILYFLIMLFVNISIFSQEPIAREIKSKNYKGYIFSNDYFVFGINPRNTKSHYTPTIQDIQEVETILIDNIDVFASKFNPNMTKKNLKKYVRQYFGFINEDNEIVIYVNFLKNIDQNQKLKINKEFLSILDGGDDYWQVYINIIRKKLFGLTINSKS